MFHLSYVDGGICCIGSVPPQEHITQDNTLEEEKIVKQQVKDSVVDKNIVVQICGLAKTYPCGFGLNRKFF